MRAICAGVSGLCPRSQGGGLTLARSNDGDRGACQGRAVPARGGEGAQAAVGTQVGGGAGGGGEAPGEDRGARRAAQRGGDEAAQDRPPAARKGLYEGHVQQEEHTSELYSLF